MKLPSLAAAAAMLLASSSHAQKLLEWTEATSGVVFGVGIPEAAAAPYDMLLTIRAPASAGWVGWAAGGCMLRSPILVAWPNGAGVMVSPRWANAYHPPMLYNGTTAKVYSTSTSNATHWNVNLLCSGCSKWDGGVVDPNGNATFGWGVSSHKVDPPTSAGAPIRFHDVGKAHFELDMKQARLSKEAFDGAVKAMGG